MTASHAATTHVTPYDRLAGLDDQLVEQLLASGKRRDELITYFGGPHYAELAALARRARRVRRNRGSVFVLPGIMGSQLGHTRSHPHPADVLWLDPVDIAGGRLAELTLRKSNAHIRAFGVLLYSYMKLRLELALAGYEPVLHAYDWRQSIARLGRELALRLAPMRRQPIGIVAHSMGGLVARAALALPGTAHVERLIMLGTPNRGSYAIAQALRGTYAVVRKVATLDRTRTAEQLATRVFSTFPSIYEMVPHAEDGALDLGRRESWPLDLAQPAAYKLRAARAAQRALAPGDDRMHVIAGHGLQTVTGLTRTDRQFTYSVTRAGDGTVPLASARLGGAGIHYVREEHSALPLNAQVGAAVIDLLAQGSTARLSARAPRAPNATGRISDAALRRTFRHKLDWAGLSPDERRMFLQHLNEPPPVVLRPIRAQHSRKRGKAGRSAP